jgi:glutamine synthetase
MVGSSDSIASPNTTLNAIVAEAFCEAADILEAADDFELAVHDLIKEYMAKHQRIIFNGDGYSEGWVTEAENRGLPNIKSMIEAVETLTTDKAIKLFEKFGIFTKTELESREEILYETYVKTINIEALTMIEMARKQIIPTAVRYSKSLADTVIALKEAGADTSVSAGLLSEVTTQVTDVKAALVKLEVALGKTGDISSQKDLAFYYKDEVRVIMEALRTPADALEMLVDKEMWPFPTYGDLIFEV